ncbi:hypothetical protein GDO78_018881 [Eleutherodactylus coqui]|uniref:Uncharacterized protein n=1 Tax=Eleutherodactylus coqui TaxID=57060 RepID=A0A8J6BC69_ELECQ|nr:hypothetical protein GDO78_018881 [Eleutherodactylus coqui]
MILECGDRIQIHMQTRGEHYIQVMNAFLTATCKLTVWVLPYACSPFIYIISWIGTVRPCISTISRVTLTTQSCSATRNSTIVFCPNPHSPPISALIDRCVPERRSVASTFFLLVEKM